jgi:hypothetical protein
MMASHSRAAIAWLVAAWPRASNINPLASARLWSSLRESTKIFASLIVSMGRLPGWGEREAGWLAAGCRNA